MEDFGVKEAVDHEVSLVEEKEAEIKIPPKIKEDNTIRILLVLTVIAGFIFRVINAHTRRVLGDPAHFVVNAKNFLNSGLLVTWDQSTFLWYAVTDTFYKIFGVTQFATRFSSVLFGTATILVIFLFVKEFSGNKRVALISAMLYAFVPAFIFHAADEHDISTLFFISFAFYYLIKGLKRNTNKFIIYSAVLFGVACMWKAYVPILVVPWAGFILYYHMKGKYNLWKNYKVILWCGVIVVLLVSPVLVYNYSNIKHNDVPTFFFAKFFSSLKNDKVQEVYGWVSYGELYKGNTFLQRMFISNEYGTQFEEGSHSILYYGITTSIYSNGHFIWPIIFVGLVFLFLRRKQDKFAKDYLVFFLLYFLIPFIFLIDGNFMNKHFLHFLYMGLPVAAYLFDSIYLYARKKSKGLDDISKNKNSVYLLFGLLLLFEIFVVLSFQFDNGLFFSKNPAGEFINYKLDNIPENAFVVYDDRIYNSLAAWLFNDRYYITVSTLNQFMTYNEQSTSKQNTEVYFIECVTDDCGWGNIGDNPGLNESMEEFFAAIQSQGIPEVITIKREIRGVDRKYYNPLISSDVGPDYYRIYKTNMNIDLNLAKQIKAGHNSFMYPIGYENTDLPVFKNFVYTPSGGFEILLNKLAWFIFYLLIFLSFLAIPWVILEAYIYI
jgi:4-amino-4-deoxy-L-arabinose transferase-like glycosyltransferase